MGRFNRRIPNELRKRSAQSCDLCKAKRCKCVPSGEGTTCVSCLDQGVQCTYTAPRKQRFYGSIDNLSDRYRCLDAIVKGAFPDDDHGTTEGLLQLGAKLGVQMPDPHDPSRQTVSLNKILRHPESSENSAQSGLATNGGVAQPDPVKDEPTSDRSADSPPAETVRDSSGNEYYIGPSGSLAFFNQLRDVFASTQMASTALRQATDHRLNTAETLEGSLAAQSEPPGSFAGPADIGLSSDLNWDQAVSHLLPTQLMETLISSYFRTTHQDYPLFHQASFRNECRALWNPVQDHPGVPRKPDWGLLGSLYMVLVFGSISNPAIPGVDHAVLQHRYVAATRTLLPHMIQKCSLSNLRALVLLSLFLHNNGERNATWNLTGTAVRMAFALGLHRKGHPSSAQTITQYSKQLVLSSLYSFELFLAASLGRPSALNEADLEIFPLHDGAEQNDVSNVDLRLLDLTLKLNSILERTRVVQAKRKPTSNAPPSDGHGSRVDDILDRLKAWKDELARYPDLKLPTFLKGGITGTLSPVDGPQQDVEDYGRQLLADPNPRPNLRGCLMLHIQFHYIGIVTTRHFLLHDIAAARLSDNSSADGISTLAQTCCFHSFQLASCFVLLDKLGLVNGVTSLDIFYGYWAGMLLNLLLLRPPGGQPILVEGPDGRMVCFLSLFVRQVQQIISRADKSVTMRRLSSVFDTFVDWAQRVTRDASESAAASQQSGNGTVAGSSASSAPSTMPSSQAPASVGPAQTPMDSFSPFANAAMNYWMMQNMMPGFSMVGAHELGMGAEGDGEGGMLYSMPGMYYGDDHAAMLGIMDLDAELMTGQGYEMRY